MLALSAQAIANAAPTLVPGNGFSGATPQPSTVGSGFGADAKAIARWDVVPFQLFDDKFEVGVVAFHINEIDRVEFSVEGGPWTAVHEMTLNPRTGVVEYWAELDASLFDTDGLIEIRAIAYPTVGVPRVLGEDIRNRDVQIYGNHAMQLIANGNGAKGRSAYISPTGSNSTGDGTASKPWRKAEYAVDTIRGGGNADNITVYLLPGYYDDSDVGIGGAPTQNGWVTISGAPGATRDQVVVLYPNNVESKLHAFRNLTFDIPAGSGAPLLRDGSKERSLWLDNVHLKGGDRTNNVDIIGGSTIFASYGTNVLLEDNAHGLTLHFLRDPTVRRIGTDTYTRCRFLVNATVEDVDRDASGVPTAHPDIKQFGSLAFNNIVYGLQAHKNIRSQGLFATDFVEDFACVDVHLDNRPSPHSYRVNNVNHMVVKNTIALDRVGSLDDTAHNVLFENCKFRVDSDGSPEYGNTDQPDVIWRSGSASVPFVSIGSPSVATTATGPVSYVVTYNNADSVSLSPSNITLNKSGTANGSVSVSGTGTSQRTVTISNISGTGTLGISIASGTASNDQGSAGSAGPSATVTVSNSAPTITMLGDTPVTISIGDTYTDAGATASDAEDGNITNQIQTNSNVNTSVAGQYTVTYTVTDSDGNNATPKTRDVIVVAISANTDPVITVLGANPVEIAHGASYSDAGATALDAEDGDLTGQIQVNSDVDTSRVGQNTVTYAVTDSDGNTASATRIVRVVDSEPPVITLIGANPAKRTVGRTYSDPGATAFDDVDGDLTSTIAVESTVDTSTVGEYTVTYRVSDASGNAAAPAVRIVQIVDDEPPVITLLGQNPAIVSVGEIYSDAGATATDNKDGDLTSQIQAASTVNTNQAGEFTVTYTVSDSSGNEAEPVVRTVNVVPNEAPIITILGDNPTSMSVGETYSDAGATATDAEDGDLTDAISMTTDVDTSVVGQYWVTYHVTDSMGKTSEPALREVNVVDDSAPTIIVLGENPATVQLNGNYNDAGATATDAVDGDLTAQISVVNNVNTSQLGAYAVTYSVSDSSGNTAQAARTVNVVSQGVNIPVITLLGDNPAVLSVGAAYVDAGATAVDEEDGDITDQVQVNSDVNTAAAGDYTVTYSVSNSDGNPAAPVVRTVQVVASNAAVLIPGNGFNAPTAQPAAIGSGLGADATAIGRWDVVPFQTFDGVFEIGVVAFHMMGIDRVEFSANGGPWTPVREMTLNPRTGIVEYWATLDASLFRDGPVEVRAIVYPTIGVPRVLGSDIRNRDAHIYGNTALHLVANGNGANAAKTAYVSTSGSNDAGDGSATNPYRTVQHAVEMTRNGGSADHLSVYLLPGTYTEEDIETDSAPTNNGWLTVAGAPGQTRGQVVAQYPRSIETTFHAFRNMTFNIPAGSGPNMLTDGTKARSVWLDNVHIRGESVETNVIIIQGSKVLTSYATDVLVERNRNGLEAHLQRRVTQRFIKQDSFTRGRLLIDVVAENLDQNGYVMQLGRSSHNQIVYGMTAVQGITSSGIFSGWSVEDFAVVNANIDNRPNKNTFRISSANHMVIKNVIALDNAGSLDDSAHNVLFENSQFREAGEDPRYGNVDQPDVIWVGPPTVSIEGPMDAKMFRSVSYIVRYMDADEIMLSPEDVLVESNGNAPFTVEVSGTGNLERVVTISDLRGNGEIAIKIAPGTASNEYGEAPSIGPSEPFAFTDSAPIITLNGSDAVTVELTHLFVDEGATAFDAEDGDLTAQITATSDVNTNVVGTYSVAYNVSDSDGNPAEPVVRTVQVVGTITSGRTFHVNSRRGLGGTGSAANPYASITQVLTNLDVQSGDVIQVAPGTYSESIVVPEGVSLQSTDGASQTWIMGDAKSGEPVITLSDGTTLSGFTVGLTPGVTAVHLPAGMAAAVRNCVIAESAKGVRAEPEASLTMINCTVAANTEYGVYLEHGATLPMLLNSIFADNGVALSATDGTKAILGYNAFYGNAVDLEGVQPDESNMTGDPMFVYPQNHNYNLRQDSPFRDAGDPSAEYNDADGTRNDLGAEGGPWGGKGVDEDGGAEIGAGCSAVAGNGAPQEALPEMLMLLAVVGILGFRRRSAAGETDSAR